jgi:hypothetical protein
MTRNFKFFFFVVVSTIISNSVFAQRIESFYVSATEIEEKNLSDDYIGINLQAIPTGQYTVRIESQGSPLDSKTLIVY